MDSTLSLFAATGAYLKGHFRLTSGLHSPEYLQCALVLQHPRHAEQLGQAMAALFQASGNGTGHAKPETVVAPAMGGLMIGHEVARALGTRSIFTERDADGKMTLRRGFTVQPGERCVVVEDVITTGGSTKEVVELLRGLGAEVTGAGSIIDRSGGRAEVGVPRVALVSMQVTAWKPEECPLCAEGLPVVKPGSRPAA
ncbi:MAG: orotate phosphoribosyltransferase [Bryobacteraceae bacterium]|nr:orotate phosphoribosyltransferase [Bryobacteraceae bacterium]